MIWIVAIVGFVAVWTWFLHRLSGRRMWSPLWLAFSTTAVAILFLVAGSAGYTLSRHVRFANGTAWSNSVIWWQVWVGLLAAGLAAVFWSTALRSLRPPRLE